jgi:hypothetical protein
MSPKIRVLRLLEYIYDTAERAQKDQERWQVPANGSRLAGDMIVRSAIITDMHYVEETITIPAADADSYYAWKAAKEDYDDGTGMRIRPGQ